MTERKWMPLSLGLASLLLSAGSPPPGFCVAKYEMKDVGSVATSQAGGSPWGGLTRDDARSAEPRAL